MIIVVKSVIKFCSNTLVDVTASSDIHGRTKKRNTNVQFRKQLA